MSEQTPIPNHEYDGIQEYDNPLPMWWLATFYGTIIFGFLYWVHYEFGGASTQRQELAYDLSEIQKNQPKKVGDSEEDLQKLAGVASVASKGKEIFGAKCAVCHGPELQGVIGPNLTDEYWIHGKGTLADVSKVVRSGVADKGMPAWESQLPDDDIRAVVVFVVSRRGSNPPNPKAPQGDKIGN